MNEHHGFKSSRAFIRVRCRSSDSHPRSTTIAHADVGSRPKLLSQLSTINYQLFPNTEATKNPIENGLGDFFACDLA